MDTNNIIEDIRSQRNNRHGITVAVEDHQYFLACYQSTVSAMIPKKVLSPVYDPAS